MKLVRHRFAGFLILLLAGLALDAAAARKYTVTEIPTLGGRTSHIVDVSQSGILAGWSETTREPGSFDNDHAILWRNGRLEDLDSRHPASQNRAQAVNNSGMAVGGAIVDGSGYVAYWKNGKMTVTDILGSASGVNDSSVIVGSYWNGAGNVAFEWRNGFLTEIGTMGGRESTAVAVNRRGAVLGFSALGDDFQQSTFIWERGKLRDLGTIDGALFVRGEDMNDSGAVVGTVSGAPWGGTRAFIHDGTMRLLFPEAGDSFATAINNRGDIVGRIGTEGFVLEGGVVTFLSQVPGVAARGWTFVVPTAINDRGWIVGTAINADGHRRGFLLVPRG